jgi:dTDP-4-amino-4,6-dideoxygalactose transaminase
MKPIPLAKPLIGRKEIRQVVKVLKSGNLTQGPYVKKLEEGFSKYVGGRPCVAVNSGTSALHIALLSLGIGSGDEVLVPSFTFAASANAISLTGATPIFVDIDPLTFNISLDCIKKSLTSKTKAILAVHLYGLPAPMPEIMDIAKKFNLLVIEDAAQAHLASINKVPVGTFGDAAAFSFYPTKNMTTGEGGMVVLASSDAERTCRLLRSQGMEIRYQNEIVGFNLRMTDIHAAIGLEQLNKISHWTEIRQNNAAFLSNNLDSSFYKLPHVPSGYSHCYHQYTVRISGVRDLVSQKLDKEKIGNAVYYPTPVHLLQAFSASTILPETTLATQEVLSIPVHPSLTKRDLKIISKTLNKISESL